MCADISRELGLPHEKMAPCVNRVDGCYDYIVKTLVGFNMAGEVMKEKVKLTTNATGAENITRFNIFDRDMGTMSFLEGLDSRHKGRNFNISSSFKVFYAIRNHTN